MMIPLWQLYGMELDIRRTARFNFKNNLHILPYKLQLTQQLQPTNYEIRRQYSYTVMQLKNQNNFFEDAAGNPLTFTAISTAI